MYPLVLEHDTGSKHVGDLPAPEAKKTTRGGGKKKSAEATAAPAATAEKTDEAMEDARKKRARGE